VEHLFIGLIENNWGMGYLKDKYTKSYFLKQNVDGKFDNIGVEGAEIFFKGKGNIRIPDLDILRRIDFSNKNVLEFGYGRGESLWFASQNGAAYICGVDFSNDAFELASNYLKEIKVDLFCDDGLNFITKNNFKNKFDIIIMFDFVEHVPRTELSDIFINLKRVINEKSIIAISTPIFKVDNDVILEGLKEEARDTSDEHDKTSGMHCNRYTLFSLKEFMKKCGFTSISGHIFINGLVINNCRKNKQFFTWNNALIEGFPVLPFLKSELFEYAYTNSKQKGMKTKIVRRTKEIIKQFAPPIITNFYKKKIRKNNGQVEEKYIYNPEWHNIKDGLLKDHQIYVDMHDGFWQKEMVEGIYDQQIFGFLSKVDLMGKIAFEVGAHIGYNAMCFSKLVGDKGKVICFEPNYFNRARMELILTKNHDFNNIKLYPYAISDSISQTEFNFSDQIDNGYSSGGFILSSSTPWTSEDYQKIGFKKEIVKTVPIDKLDTIGINEEPSIIKVDVEGAENFVLNGAYSTLLKSKPIVFIEIHSRSCMYAATNMLTRLVYNTELLKEEVDGRCHIVAFCQ